MTAARRATVIEHPGGLHARPAVKLTKLAKSFPGAVRLRALPEGDWVDGKSVVRVMGLKLRAGTAVELEAEGEGAEAALAELAALIERGFDEGHG